jgi:chemotaxis response regulator CheB
MGRDGAAGLKRLRDAGAETIAQEPGSCAVASMPISAIELDAVCTVCRPEKIPNAIANSILHDQTGVLKP